MPRNIILTIVLYQLCMLLYVPQTQAVDTYDYTAYFGIDAQYQFLKFKAHNGKDFFKPPTTELALYSGYNATDAFDLELGYFASHNKKGTAKWKPTEVKLGASTSTTDTFGVRARIQGFFLNLLGYYPLSSKLYLDGILLAGIAQEHLKLVANLETINGVIASQSQIKNNSFDFTADKWLPRIGAGIRFRITRNIGLRILACWEKSSIFKIEATKPGDLSTNLEVRLKDSIFVSAGVLLVG